MFQLISDNRGVSELVGMVLLIGMVATGALLVVVLGSAGIDDVRTQTDEQQASTILQEFDSRLSTLAASSDDPRAEYDLGATNPRQFNVKNRGWLNVTVNERAACSANMTLTSLRFENNNNVLVGYEAGGVWKRFPSNDSSMVTEPSVRSRTGTIDIQLINMTGTIDQSKNELRLDTPRTRAQSATFSRSVATGDCARPDNVTLSIQSPFYQAWARYIESEFGVSATAYDDNETAMAFIPQSALPARVDDSRNTVVNLSSASPYNTVSITSDSITVDKGVSNRYPVSVTTLSTGTLDAGNITSVENATNVTRPPLDVMFVIDESGSMSWDDGDGVTRSQEAQAAARDFTGDLNETRDRAGVVSYDTSSQYRQTSSADGNRYISDEFTMIGVNGSIEDIPDSPSGGTDANVGLEKANNVIELQSNGTRKRAIVLLTDGVNNGCSDTNDDDPYDCYLNRETVDRANESAANGVTIYTVGYGDDGDIDEALLQKVAEQTGGSYYQATSASQLDSVFQDIRREIARTKMIAKAPVSSNYTSGTGSVYSPQAAGNTDQIARYEINGEQFSNINDPTAGSEFSHSFAITGGESVEIEAYEFECDQWAGTGRVLSHAGDRYQVARCTNITTKDGTLSPTGIYLDGDNVSHLLKEDEAWWQDDINDTFAANDDVSVCKSTNTGTPPVCAGGFGTLQLESNQALVYFDLTDGDESTNRLLMLYEVGIAESDAETTDAINIEYSTVHIED